jgi:hypothetical protein
VGLQIHTNRQEGDTIALCEVCKIGRSNEPYVVANMAQGSRKRHVWLHVAARAIAEKRHIHSLFILFDALTSG